MSNFKVGDKVVRTGCSLFWHGILKGGIYTVSVQRYSHVQLAETTGCPTALFDADLFRLAKYSEYFTDAKPASAPLLLGHVADSPIQKHSVGEFYPLSVVGYGQGDTVVYVVENLKDQTVSGYIDALRQWERAANAQRFLERVAKGDDGFIFPVVWHKARPVFGKDGGLVLPPAPAKRTRVVFEKQDGIIEINGAYYKALEQDIG